MTKAHEGAWIIMVLIPIIVLLFKMTHGHYSSVANQLTLRGWETEGTVRANRVLVHALLIKGALLFKPNTVVTSIPFHLAR